MIYNNCKIYGPYKRPDNREHVVVVFPDKHKKTISYPKYLMEKHLNRLLDPNLETIDHIDGDTSNNNLLNLQIIPRKSHAALDTQRVKSQTFTCSICNTDFILSDKKLNDAIQNRLKGKSGPYCSKSCAGKATHLNLNDPRLKTHNVKIERYTNKNPNLILSSSNSEDRSCFKNEIKSFVNSHIDSI